MIAKKAQAWSAVATLIVLLMLPNFIWVINCVGDRAWDRAIIVPSLLLLFMFALFGKRVWLACLLLSPFAILAPIECFYIAAYRRPSGMEVLGSITATTLSETLGYFGWLLLPLALGVIAGLFLALLAVRMSYRAELCWSNRVREWIFASGIILPIMVVVVATIHGKGSLHNRADNGVLTFMDLGTPINEGFPFGVIARLWDYRNEWDAMYVSYAKLDNFRFNATERKAIEERQVYVLVVGESSRRNHWQMFGYERQTNPELMKVQNLIPISDMVTSWPETMMAVPLLLTRKPITDKNLAWNEASILRAMQEAGYETWWISNQLAVGQFDSPVSTYAMEAQHLEFVNHASWNDGGNYDKNLLNPLRKMLANAPQKNLFIVLHMMGSHVPYDLRYPPTSKQFTPIISDKDSAVPQELRFRNSYDNTILYTDHILAQIIDILGKSNTVSALWFESDHGETLPTPTCSKFGHGIGTRYDYMVPALFWYSDAYASHFPDRIAQLRDNANKRVLSASSFESLIDMAGVNFPGHDESWSLFSPQWSYHPRIVNGFWSTDIDKAQFGKGCELVLPANP